MTPNQPRPIVVLLSGGVNSVAASMRVLEEWQPHFLHVDHGQAASENEREAATHVAQALAGTFHIAQLPLAATAANPISTGTEASAVANASPASPNENRAPGTMLAMLGIAQRLAHRVGADTIVCGASQLCNNLDPDARHIFHHAAQVAVELGSPEGEMLTLDTPFMDATRTDIIRVGNRMGAPFHLSWSCHGGQSVPCGVCWRCRSRSEAFDELGLPDPRFLGAAGRIVHERIVS